MRRPWPDTLAEYDRFMQSRGERLRLWRYFRNLRMRRNA